MSNGAILPSRPSRVKHEAIGGGEGMTDGRTVDFTPDPRPRWRLATNAVEATLALDPSGLSLLSLTIAEGGIAHQFVDPHPLTSFALAGERTPSRGWRLRGWEVEEEKRARRLIVTLEADGGLVLT